MPTLPLFQIPHDRDRSHKVIAPGGYEWWRFEANAGATRVRIDLFDGDPFSSAYRAAYARYRRRPTRVVPPTPRDFPRLRMVLAEGAHTPSSTEFCDVLRLSDDPPQMSIGPLSLWFEDGRASLRLTIASEPFEGELRFRKPDGAQPQIRQFDADEKSAADYWISYDGVFEVSGTIKTREFRGTGRLDHFFGTGPMGARMQEALKNLGD